eukprot:SAG31_NODE_33903_length_339_cov_0.358333_2_plen_24_part_01
MRKSRSWLFWLLGSKFVIHPTVML